MGGQSRSGTTLLLFTLVLCAFLIGLDLLVVTPLTPSIASAVHFPMQTGGLLVTAYALLNGLAAPIFGPISDRWGRKRMMIAGICVFAVGTILTGCAQNFTQLLVVRAMAGLGAAMLLPCVYATVGDAFPYEQRGKAMGAVSGAIGGATVFGMPIGTFFTQVVSWRVIFMMIGVLAVVVLFAVIRVVPGSQNRTHGKPSTGGSLIHMVQLAVRTPAVLAALFGTFLWWAGFQGLFSVMGVFYFQYFGLHPVSIGYIFAGTGLMNWLGNRLGGRFADVLGKKAMVLLASLVSAGCVLLLPMMAHHSLALAIAIHLVWAIATGWGQSSLLALVSEIAPQARGTVLSLNSSATYLGMTAATAISAWLLQQSGFPAVGSFCSALLAGMALLVGTVYRERTRQNLVHQA